MSHKSLKGRRNWYFLNKDRINKDRRAYQSEKGE